MVRRNTLILVAVFAALVLVMVLLQRNAGSENADLADIPTSAPVTMLFDFGSQTVVGLQVRNLDGNQVDMVQEGEAWRLASASAEESDSERISNAVAQIASLRVINTAPINADLATIGLQFPVYYITLTLSDGGQHEIAVGEKSVTNTGFYVIVDDGEPQLITRTILEQLIGLLDDPPLLPTPTPAPEELNVEPTATAQP